MPVNPFTFNYLLPATGVSIAASYADQHKTTFLNGLKARAPDYERSQRRGWDMNIYHCCLDGTVAASAIRHYTSLQASE